MFMNRIQEIHASIEAHQKTIQSIPNEPFTYRNNPHADIEYHKREIEKLREELKRLSKEK